MSKHDQSRAKAWARAEELRREACRLAERYERLAVKRELDREIVALDAAAVLRAWQRLSPPR